jgi:hypothetical protein
MHQPQQIMTDVTELAPSVQYNHSHGKGYKHVEKNETIQWK